MRAYFDHERLTVYKRATQFATWSTRLLDEGTGSAGLRNQLERASVSIALNIAEGNGKTMKRDRTRFLEIARGSALECAACLDLLVASASLDEGRAMEGKDILREVVAMLTGLMGSIAKRAREDGEEYSLGQSEQEQEQG